MYLACLKNQQDGQQIWRARAVKLFQFKPRIRHLDIKGYWFGYKVSPVCCVEHNKTTLYMWRQLITEKHLYFAWLIFATNSILHIHKTLFSRLSITCILILTWKKIFSSVFGLVIIRENKLIAIKKCFTVSSKKNYNAHVLVLWTII